MAIDVFGRTISGRLVPYGVANPLSPGHERYVRGVFGVAPAGAAGKGVPLVGKDDRGSQVILGRSTQLTETRGALYGEFRILDGRHGDRLLVDARAGCFEAFTLNCRTTAGGRAADGGVEVRSATLISVSLTGLDPWPEGDDLVEARRAELLTRYGITPPPVVDLSPIPALRRY